MSRSETMKKWIATYTTDRGTTYQTTDAFEAPNYTLALMKVWPLGDVTDLKEICEGETANDGEREAI